MIKWIRRWWKHAIKRISYVYVITVDGKVSIVLYNRWEAYNHCIMLAEGGVDDVEMIETEIL